MKLHSLLSFYRMWNMSPYVHFFFMNKNFVPKTSTFAKHKQREEKNHAITLEYNRIHSKKISIIPI